MTFPESLQILGIADFEERIYNSNSHGELMHLADYHMMAAEFPPEMLPYFRTIFLSIVDYCGKNWRHPESCFQHMPELFRGFWKVMSK